MGKGAVERKQRNNWKICHLVLKIEGEGKKFGGKNWSGKKIGRMGYIIWGKKLFNAKLILYNFYYYCIISYLTLYSLDPFEKKLY